MDRLTVKELIKVLEKMPQDAYVFYMDSDYGPESVSEAVEREMFSERPANGWLATYQGKFYPDKVIAVQLK